MNPITITVIKNIYQRSENIKIGAELKISPIVFRVGYAKFGSAYKNYDLGPGITDYDEVFDDDDGYPD